MRRIATLILLSVIAVGVPVDRATAATTALAADGYIGVDGRGFGHGRGLGQWGAKGLADQGKSWTEILAHYYRSTTLATRAPETIRVLLSESSPGPVYTSQSHPFSIYWKGGAKVAESSSSLPFLRVAPSGSNLSIERGASTAGPWTSVATGPGPAEVHPGAQTIGLVATNGSVRYYRGRIEARRPGGTGPVLSINDLSMDAYLYGVVPREMPAVWEGDALRAQAVAARSYAATKKDAARAANKLYDICVTTSCQVYGGYASGGSPTETPKVLEHSNTNDAVNATAGRVLTYQSKPILAEYSSSTGGYTADGSLAYQQAVADPADSVSPYHSWTTRIDVPKLSTAWPQIGSPTGVRVTKRNGFGEYGGRVTEMVVEGTSGSVTISGNTFRSKMGIRSNWFRVRTYRAERISVSSDVTGPSGSSIPVSVTLRNIGNADWRVGGSELIATWSPSGRESRFASSSWVSATKPGRITRNLSRSTATTVGPGETAEFRFSLNTQGIAPGVYTESFRPLVDGLGWFNDVGLTITVRVLSSWLEDAGNLLTNGSFESGWSSWSGYGGIKVGDGPSTGTVRAGARSMHLAAGGDKGIVQRMSLHGGAGRRIVLGGWARTVDSRSDGGAVQLTLALRNNDGTVTWNAVPFSRGPHDWQYAERLIVAPKPFNSADVYATFYGQAGRVYYDAIRITDTWLLNPSFELGTAGWSATGLGSGDGPSGSIFKDGYRSMHLGGGTKSLKQRVAIRGPAGRRFHVAGWTKADRASAAGTTALAVTFNNTDGSRSLTTIPATAGDHDWEYRERQVTAAKPYSSIDLAISVAQQTGSVFFDAIRLRENRLENPSFESGLSPWLGTASFGGSDGASALLSRDASSALRLIGGGRRGARASVDSSGSAGAVVLAGAWNRTAASGGRVSLGVVFRNRDGSQTSRVVYFNDTAHDWMHAEVLARADKAYSSIELHLFSDGSPGEVSFDGVTLWAPQ